jgi:hypothetical protein
MVSETARGTVNKTAGVMTNKTAGGTTGIDMTTEETLTIINRAITNGAIST